MMGSLVGFKKIPEYMVQKVLSFDCTVEYDKWSEDGSTRPELLNVSKHAVPLIKRIIELRPKKDIKYVK
jgi:hypothetical protein